VTLSLIAEVSGTGGRRVWVVESEREVAGTYRRVGQIYGVRIGDLVYVYAPQAGRGELGYFSQVDGETGDAIARPLLGSPDGGGTPAPTPDPTPGDIVRVPAGVLSAFLSVSAVRHDTVLEGRNPDPAGLTEGAWRFDNNGESELPDGTRVVIADVLAGGSRQALGIWEVRDGPWTRPADWVLNETVRVGTLIVAAEDADFGRFPDVRGPTRTVNLGTAWTAVNARSVYVIGGDQAETRAQDYYLVITPGDGFPGRTVAVEWPDPVSLLRYSRTNSRYAAAGDVLNANNRLRMYDRLVCRYYDRQSVLRERELFAGWESGTGLILAPGAVAWPGGTRVSMYRKHLARAGSGGNRLYTVTFEDDRFHSGDLLADGSNWKLESVL